LDYCQDSLNIEMMNFVILPQLISHSSINDVVMVAIVKVYANQNYAYGYIENDRICGHDSYRTSKSAAGMVIGSWRSWYCGTPIHQRPHLAIAPALVAWPAVPVRRPKATRPWQHLAFARTPVLLPATGGAPGAINGSP
jgi:CDP-glucose 4,6-dehydratase